MPPLQVKLDRTAGARWSRSAAGDAVIRIARVAGLSDRAGSVSDRLRDAIASPGVPRLGDRHPTVAGLAVVAIDAEAESPDVARVSIRYGLRSSTSSPAAVTSHDASAIHITQLAATMQHDITSRDHVGRLLTVTHTQGETTTTQIAQPRVSRPTPTLRLTRTVSQSVVSLAMQYVGSVNRHACKHGGAPGTWLCLAVEATTPADAGDITRANNRTANVTRRCEQRAVFVFAYRASGWAEEITWRDPMTGLPPGDLVANVGRRTVAVHPQSDFRPVGL